MAHRFERTRRGVAGRLDESERQLLRTLFLDVAQLLDEDLPASTDPLEDLVGINDAARPPQDPALARLLPAGSSDDDDASHEFRRLTERGLRQRKQSSLGVAAETLERPGALVLAAEEASAWLTALNDVRLVVAERIGVRTEDDAERLLHPRRPDATDDGPDAEGGAAPQAWLVSVYDFLTWLQETLVAAMTERRGPSLGRHAR